MLYIAKGMRGYNPFHMIIVANSQEDARAKLMISLYKLKTNLMILSSDISKCQTSEDYAKHFEAINSEFKKSDVADLTFPYSLDVEKELTNENREEISFTNGEGDHLREHYGKENGEVQVSLEIWAQLVLIEPLTESVIVCAGLDG